MILENHITSDHLLGTTFRYPYFNDDDIYRSFGGWDRIEKIWHDIGERANIEDSLSKLIEIGSNIEVHVDEKDAKNILDIFMGDESEDGQYRLLISDFLAVYFSNSESESYIVFINAGIVDLVLKFFPRYNIPSFLEPLLEKSVDFCVSLIDGSFLYQIMHAIKHFPSEIGQIFYIIASISQHDLCSADFSMFIDPIIRKLLGEFEEMTCRSGIKALASISYHSIMESEKILQHPLFDSLFFLVEKYSGYRILIDEFILLLGSIISHTSLVSRNVLFNIMRMLEGFLIDNDVIYIHNIIEAVFNGSHNNMYFLQCCIDSQLLAKFFECFSEELKASDKIFLFNALCDLFSISDYDQAKIMISFGFSQLIDTYIDIGIADIEEPLLAALTAYWLHAINNCDESMIYFIINNENILDSIGYVINTSKSNNTVSSAQLLKDSILNHSLQ